MASQVTAFLGESANVFAVLGVVATAYIALKCLRSLWTGFRAYILPAGVDLKRMGSWAVVTGATDGIGKAYAEELARKGLHIVLISRNPDKLADVASEIENNFKVQTKCVAVDFSRGPEIYDKIRDEVNGLEVGVLVNNVGMGYEYPEFFGSIPTDQKIHDMINVNITSVTMTTKVILPSMTERKKGVIINISSASGVRPTPLLTVYSASKVYVDFFSRALQAEYKSKGIYIQSVTPFFVATKLSKIRKTSVFVPGPNTYAKAALGTVGIQDQTYGCVSHEIQGLVTGCVPQWIFDAVTISQMLPLRSKALKKLQKTQ